MDPLTIIAVAAAAIGAVGSVVSGFQKKRERQEAQDSIDSTNAQNLAIQQEQWAREDNAYQRAVEDAKSAGLSAFSVAGSGGSDTTVSYEAKDKSGVPSADIGGSFQDLVKSMQGGVQIAGAKYEMEKNRAEAENIDEQTDYNRRMHWLDLQSRGIDVSYQKRFAELNIKSKELDNKRIEIQNNLSLSEEERKKKEFELDTVSKAIENTRNQLQLEEEKATIYNPEFKNQRVSNYRTELATENANMVYQTEYNRKMNEYQQILNEKYRAQSNYEIEKSKYETMELIKEYEHMDKKYRQEAWSNALDCVAKGAQGFWFISEAVRRWVPLQNASDFVSTIGFQGITN